MDNSSSINLNDGDDDNNINSKNISNEVLSLEFKSSPMAFTVDFGPTNFGISDSISKFAPERKQRQKPPHSSSTKSQSSEKCVVAEAESDTVSPSTCPIERKDEDCQSGTGTYTLDSDGKDDEDRAKACDDDFKTSEDFDTSLEWIRQWAENASKSQTDGETDPEFETGVELQKHSRMSSSWTDAYSDNDVAPITKPHLNSSHPPIKKQLPKNELYSYRATNKNMQPPSNIPRSLLQVIKQSKQRYPTPEKSLNSRSDESSFSRNDGGRFSLRAQNKSSKQPTQHIKEIPPSKAKIIPVSSKLSQLPLAYTKSGPTKASTPGVSTATAISKPQNQKTLLSGGKRANSTLTAKEVELANWNRRKNYDPMRSAALGRKKIQTNNGNEGDDGDDLVQLSNNNEMKMRELRINPDGAACISKSSNFGISYGSPTYELEYDDERPPSNSNSLGRNSRDRLNRRSYHEESTYPDDESFLHNNTIRQKHKFEALDSLVIATIHSLSNKVRTSCRHLLQKISVDDDENGALVEEMISQLKELELGSTSKGPSRELSGTLKNLKKIEQVILVLDRILCGETD